MFKASNNSGTFFHHKIQANRFHFLEMIKYEGLPNLHKDTSIGWTRTINEMPAAGKRYKYDIISKTPAV